MGEKQKTEKKERRANDGNNNGQARHGAGKPPGPIFIPKKSRSLIKNIHSPRKNMGLQIK